jgi:hypothetical protein
VAIDAIETGAYEIHADELATSDRLLARVPDAQNLATADWFPFTMTKKGNYSALQVWRKSTVGLCPSTAK